MSQAGKFGGGSVTAVFNDDVGKRESVDAFYVHRAVAAVATFLRQDLKSTLTASRVQVVGRACGSLLIVPGWCRE